MQRVWLLSIIIAVIATLIIGSGYLLLSKPKLPAPQNQPPADGAQNDKIYFVTTADPKVWPAGNLVEKGSVPDLIRLSQDLGKFKKNDLLIYFVDFTKIQTAGSETLSMVTSSDGGKTWSSKYTITVANKTNKGAPVDPSLVQLADGTLRMYFFGSEVTSGDPASAKGTHKVYSAASTDGVSFSAEPGVRFETEKLTDPEVINYKNQWYMYYSLGQKTGLAVSSDGLNFTEKPITGGEVGGVPGAVVLDNGVRIYGCGREGLGSAFSPDGENFTIDQNNVFDSVAISGIVCDPAIVILEDGTFAAVYKQKDTSPQNLTTPQPVQPSQPQETPKSDAKTEPKTSDLSVKASSIPERNYPSVIKGNWEPGENFLERMLKNHVQDLKALGVNTLSVVPGYEYKDDKPRLRGIGPISGSKQQFIDIIKDARKAGFAVLLCPDFVGGDGAKITVSEDQFLTEMKTISLEWAKIAEEQKVEYFCPSNELNWVIRYNYYLDDNETGPKKAHNSSDRFHRDFLPELQAIYKGKTMYKGASTDLTIDAKGYDYIGLDFGHYGNSPEKFRENVKSYFNAFSLSAQQSGNQWLVAELWLPYNQKGQATTTPDGQSYDELQDDLYQIVFDEYKSFSGAVKPSGLMFIAYLMDGIDIKGRPAEELIRDFFNSLL